MQPKYVTATIVGTTPLLVHRFTDASSVEKPTRRQTTAASNPREEALKAAYVAGDGTYYMSAFAIQRCMAGAGANHKMKSSRKTLRFVVPSAVRMTGDTLTILGPDGKPAPNFEIDSRPVTIPATKGRIMRHRPRWNEWKIEASMIIDVDMLSLNDAHTLLREGGESYGIGDFRPEKSGPFGCFQVHAWEVAE